MHRARTEVHRGAPRSTEEHRGVVCHCAQHTVDPGTRGAEHTHTTCPHTHRFAHFTHTPLARTHTHTHTACPLLATHSHRLPHTHGPTVGTCSQHSMLSSSAHPRLPLPLPLATHTHTHNTHPRTACHTHTPDTACHTHTHSLLPSHQGVAEVRTVMTAAVTHRSAVLHRSCSTELHH